MLTTQRPKPQTQREALDRYPRLVGHMICKSLGYFTPESAADALLHYIEGRSNWRQWCIHMAGGMSEQRLLQVGREVVERAFRNRHYHKGYMAYYLEAKALVDHVRAGGAGPIFASWF